MKIKDILDELECLHENAQMICVAPSVGLRSRIYMVGQVLKNIPGVVLGERQPYLHEKTVDIFKQELTIFGPQFHEKDFLIESIQDITDESFESRYYKLTDIKSLRGEVVLHCAEGEILELRVIHQEVLSE